MALIAIAAGDEFAIAHPGDDPGTGYLGLTFGGPALFLLGQLYFLWSVGETRRRARTLGIVALAVLALVTSGDVAARSVDRGDRRAGRRCDQ